MLSCFALLVISAVALVNFLAKYAGFALGITQDQPVLEFPMDMQKIERALRLISAQYHVQ